MCSAVRARDERSSDCTTALFRCAIARVTLGRAPHAMLPQFIAEYFTGSVPELASRLDLLQQQLDQANATIVKLGGSAAQYKPTGKPRLGLLPAQVRHLPSVTRSTHNRFSAPYTLRSVW